MKLPFLLLALCCSLLASGQTGIDQLDSDSAVVHFVRDYDARYVHYWYEVNFDHNKLYDRKWVSEADRQFTKVMLQKRWIVCDLNNDGKKDLVYHGGVRRGQADVLAFITSGDTLRHFTVGSTYAAFYPQSIDTIQQGNEQYLLLGSIPNDNYNTTAPWRERLQTDTLAFRFGGFVNKVSAKGPTTASFDSVIFQITSPWRPLPTILVVYADGNMHYYNTNDQPVMGPVTSYKTAQNAGNIQELQELLNWMRFQELQERYMTPNVSDAATMHTSVYYKNSMKRVVDYGGEGSYNLRLFYQKMSELINQSAWK